MVRMISAQDVLVRQHSIETLTSPSKITNVRAEQDPVEIILGQHQI